MTSIDKQATTFETLRAIARAHLSPQDADRWADLLRLGVRLRKAAAGEPVVGQLGGAPRLPADVAWPVWEAEGCALSFVAVLDCAALRAVATAQGEELPLATDGRLAFFLGHDEEEARIVDVFDRNSWDGARVLHLPPEQPGEEERPVPEGTPRYAAVPLTATLAPTLPATSSPVLLRAFGLDDPWDPHAHPVLHPLFDRALAPHRHPDGHQVLGHPNSIQRAVELEVAHAVLGQEALGKGDSRTQEEAARWLLLAQFDSDGDADMMWGDGGVLYWLIRPEDLAANRFDQAMFTWQCC